MVTSETNSMRLQGFGVGLGGMTVAVGGTHVAVGGIIVIATVGTCVGGAGVGGSAVPAGTVGVSPGKLPGVEVI